MSRPVLGRHSRAVRPDPHAAQRVISAAIVWALAISLIPSTALGHEVRPAYLELREVEPDRYAVTWKQPVAGDRRLRLEPALPETCAAETAATLDLTGGALIQRWQIDCRPDGLRDRAVEVVGLSGTLTDAFVRVYFLDGSALGQLLRPEAPRWVVRGEGGPAWTYLQLGIEHLLFGFDHILFVIGLAFLVRSPLRLVQTITSFTLAHSVTLALSALDVVRLSQAPVEAVIALSILYVAAELLRPPDQRSSLTSDRPWLVAFAFGLLHGFGFAGALELDNICMISRFVIRGTIYSWRSSRPRGGLFKFKT